MPKRKASDSRQPSILSYFGRNENQVQQGTGASSVRDSDSDDLDTDITEEEVDTDSKKLANLPDEKLPPMSIYKIFANRLPEFPNDSITSEIILDCLKKKFGCNKCIFTSDDMFPYKAAVFEYGEDLNKNQIIKTFETFAKKMKVEVQNKGTKTSGTLIVCYRLINETHPEIFCLCRGDSHNRVLNLADFKFRTSIARGFMNGTNLKAESYITIAGPEITVNKTNRERGLIKDMYIGHIERVYTNLEGPILENTELFRIISDDSDSCKEINLEVGQYYCRIKKFLNLATICLVLKLLSEYYRNPKPTENLSKLRLASRVDNSNKIKELNDVLMEKFYCILDGESTPNDLSLSDNFVEDWVVTPYVTLLSGDYIEETWYSSPSFCDVKSALASIQNVKEKIDEKRVVIKFKTKQGKDKCRPIQTFLHGTVIDQEGITFYKLGGKWFEFTTEYTELIDHQFIELVRHSRFEKSLLPWCKENATISLTDVKGWFDLSRTDAELLMEILETTVPFLKDGISLLNRSNCVLVESSKLFKECKEQKLLSVAEQESDQKKILSYFTNGSRGQSTDQNVPRVRVTSGTKKKTKQGRQMGKNEEKKNQKCILEKLMSESNEQNKNLKKLLQNASLKSGDICKILNEKMALCEKISDKQDGPVWKVLNPNVSVEVLDKIKETFQDQISPDRLVLFLRSFMDLKEGEYNENFQFHHVPGVRYITGDRVLTNNVELFDVMLHTRDKGTKTTYLIHVKEGFGQSTRDACSQIRISSQVLWEEWMDSRSKNTFLEGFFNNAINYKDDDIYRIKLQEQLTKLGKHKFLRMFSKGVKIIFVYAFTDYRENFLNDMVESFKPITKLLFQDIKPLGKEKFIMDILRKQNLVTDEGYISDKLASMKENMFINTIAKDCNGRNIGGNAQKEIYKILHDNGRCKSKSVIAKLELINLQEQFRRYWMDNEPKFELRLCQIPSNITH